jgi:hypothetical protein
VHGSAFVRNSAFGIFYLVAAVGALPRMDFRRPQAGIRFGIATPITAFVCWAANELRSQDLAIGIAVRKKTVQAATPAIKRNVLEQPRYQARSKSLPLIDEEEWHPLDFDRHHACIVMATIIPRIDRMESVFHRPGGYHIRVHQGPAFGDRGRAISRRPARANDLQS